MAAKVISEIQTRYSIELQGIGGESLSAIGLKSLFPMSELSLMGVFEVLPHLRKILSRIKQTTEAIVEFEPDFILSFDAPDFSFRVLKRYKAAFKEYKIENPAKLFHFVAPTVWAWRAGRAKKIAKFLDHIFCLFPFEPPYFEKVGLPASYIKHPFIEGYKEKPLFDWKKQQGIKKSTKLIGLFPGSRKGEIERMFPVLWAAAKDIYDKDKNVHFVILTLPHLHDDISKMIDVKSIPLTITEDKKNKESILTSCDFALATSGTIGFELSLARVPHVIAYKVNTLTAFVAKKLVKTPYVHLLNIHLKKKIVPELIQERCTSDRVGHALMRIMKNKKCQTEQKQAFDKLYKMLTDSHHKAKTIDIIQSFSKK